MAMVRTPPVCSDFEERVTARLKALVTVLPDGAATFYAGANPNALAKSLFPYFCITPSNPKSATIRGYVIERQGIDFTIGQATGGEIFVANGSARARAHEDRFYQICQAVFTSSFTEYLTYSKRGRVIRSRIVLQLDSRSVQLGGHQLFWWAVLNRTEKCFHYEPYS
jgi:hypothetical protein